MPDLYQDLAAKESEADGQNQQPVPGIPAERIDRPTDLTATAPSSVVDIPSPVAPSVQTGSGESVSASGQSNVEVKTVETSGEQPHLVLHTEDPLSEADPISAITQPNAPAVSTKDEHVTNTPAEVKNAVVSSAASGPDKESQVYKSIIGGSDVEGIAAYEKTLREAA